MDISLRADTKKFKKSLRLYEKQYQDKAIDDAMRWLGFDIVDENKRIMRGVFDNPTPGTMKSLQFKYTKRDQVLEVFHNRRYQSALMQNVEGDQRHMKRFEHKMGYYSVISKSAPNIDGYGNLPNGAYTKILADLQRFNSNDSTRNTKLRSQRYAPRGNRKGRKGMGVRYFSKIGKHGKPIVYFKTGGVKSSAIKPVLVGTSKPNYRKLYPFYKVARRMVRRKAPLLMRKAMDRQLRKVGLK